MTAVDLSPEASQQRQAASSETAVERVQDMLARLDKASREARKDGGPRNLPAKSPAAKVKRAQKLARKRNR